MFPIEKHEFSACRTTERAGGLQKRAGRRAAEKGGPMLMSSSPERPFVHPAGLSKIDVFQLETRPSSPLRRPFSVICNTTQHQKSHQL